MRLAEKVALVTGAGMGQGREGALLFAKEGAKVVVADIDAKAAKETAGMIEKRGGKALAVAGDVGVERDVKRMIAEAVKKFRALHVLYNNAGVLWKDRDKSVLDTKGVGHVGNKSSLLRVKDDGSLYHCGCAQRVEQLGRDLHVAPKKPAA